MKVLIMAAGYAKRMWPLTIDKPKHLLTVGGRPALDYILDQLEAIEDAEEIYVVTNSMFCPVFKGFFGQRNYRKKISVIDDGTSSEETKLGSIGDIQFAIDLLKLNDDLLVIFGDNIFTFRLQAMVDQFKKINAPLIGVVKTSLQEARKFGVVSVNPDGRVTGFEEKPENPKSDTVSTGIYMLSKRVLPRVKEYIGSGENTDAFGFFLSWLYKKEPVFALTFTGKWFDIGSMETYREADIYFREAGKP